MIAPSLPFAASVDNMSSPAVRAAFSSSVSANQRFDICQFTAPVLALWYDENVIFEDYKKLSGLPQGYRPVHSRSGRATLRREAGADGQAPALIRDPDLVLRPSDRFQTLGTRELF